MLNGVQDGEIAIIQQLDINELNRLTTLEAKFPITNVSILDETINKDKDKDLTNDLNGINNNIDLVKADTMQFKVKKNADTLLNYQKLYLNYQILTKLSKNIYKLPKIIFKLPKIIFKL